MRLPELSVPVAPPPPLSAAPTAAAPRPPRLWSVRAAIPRQVQGGLMLLGLLLPLLAWWLAASGAGDDSVFLPSPAKVWARGLSWWQDGLLGDIGISLWRVLAGFALSAVIALPLGLLVGSFRSVQALLEPLTEFIRYMPAVAFIPLVMLWVGIEESSKVAIIFIGTFFQMMLLVADDVRRVPLAQIEAAQTMGASRRELVEQVILPSAKPALLDTLRVCMGSAWTYLVVAELVAANSGLGHAILKAQRFLQTDKIFAGILVIGLIGLLTDQALRRLHRRLYPWAHLKD